MHGQKRPGLRTRREKEEEIAGSRASETRLADAEETRRANGGWGNTKLRSEAASKALGRGILVGVVGQQVERLARMRDKTPWPSAECNNEFNQEQTEVFLVIKDCTIKRRGCKGKGAKDKQSCRGKREIEQSGSCMHQIEKRMAGELR